MYGCSTSNNNPNVYIVAFLPFFLIFRQLLLILMKVLKKIPMLMYVFVG